MSQLFQQYKKVILLIYQMEKKTFLYSFLFSFTQVLFPYLSLWLTARTVSLLAEGISFQMIFKEVLFYSFLLFLDNIAMSFFEKKRSDVEERLQLSLNQAITNKLLKISYYQLQDPSLRTNYQRAKEGTNYNGGIYTFVHSMMDAFFNAVVGIILGILTLIQLYGGKTQNTHRLAQWSNSGVLIGLIIGLLVVSIIINGYYSIKSNRVQQQAFKEITFINRMFSYYYETVENYRNGSFFRLYQVKDYFLHLIKQFDLQTFQLFKKISKKNSRYQTINQTVTIFTSTCIYGLIGVKAYYEAIEIGEIILFSGYFLQFIQGINQVFNSFVVSNSIVQYLDFYYDFLEMDEQTSGTLPIEKRNDNEYIIAFHDVSFRYPKSHSWALRHVSFQLSVGEKTAIVGPNGSGKTTLVKLICRLYPVTEGKITLNGIEIEKYDPEEYRQIVGVVFQDFKLLSFPLADNVATSKQPNEERVKEGLNVAGIYERVERLPKGMKTTLYRNLDSDGVDISGGEAQKIAIARAWYKNSPFVILDEPTSALDPYSEYEIYKRFDELVQEKTSIYISHRMSSAKLSQRILVFDNGQIKEQGTHNQLLKENGLYARLFNAQAQYYREEQDEKNLSLFL
ncbi:ABC transporter ATP-binding protein [Enterococcus phoeniculicola]|uniref:ABC transporter domain-containing protein n=1 Tax=Enterococcus phoeniculicola ATCC BAA-412 TaxID=1158610 RepID=R3WQD0_9ENTE|nr:ABC transporter ATP-binding protein [Enterococcus phoeniculicola]EOL44020.1 hypothetical protein UC3_01650 [Enterococcus phoeniculicola ATCC BAA-412]EOT75122.1 hypothetical protein I589_02722 [Enterococcus phoeniculicola ATCC BAA-412]